MSRLRILRAVSLTAGVLLWLCAHAVFSQGYPNAVVRIVVPFAAGGSADTHARFIATKLTEAWGKQVNVDNRPGVGGSLGTAIVARSPADGYTLLMGASPIAIAPSFFPNLAYDSIKDLKPVTLLIFEPNVLLVHPSLGVDSLRELMKLIKARPGEINFASAGAGTSTHLSGEMFKSMTGLNIVHVAYKGNPPAIIDLITGRVSMMFINGSTAVPLAKSGKLKALAVGGAKRTLALPDVPTVTESGIPGFESVAWSGIIAPAKTPPEVTDKLHTELTKILRSAEMQERLASLASEPGGQGPEEFATFFAKEIQMWSKVVKETAARGDLK